MCTGLEILGAAGAAASAIGTMIQQQQANANQVRMAEARNNELKRTLIKNDALAQQSRDTFNERTQKINAEEMAADQDQATQTREDAMTAAVDSAPQPAAEVALSGSAPAVVKSELAKRMSDAITSTKQSAARQAKLAGYGDSWLNQGFKDVEAGRDIAQDANFASGNMALLPYQQDIAEMRAYKPISPLGGLLQGFGSMVSSYAGSGGGGVPKKQMFAPGSWAAANAGYV